jgi:hypothetical protein
MDSVQGPQCPKRLRGPTVNEDLIAHVVVWLQQVVPDAIEISLVTPGSVQIRSVEGPELVIQDVASVLNQPDISVTELIRAAFDSLLSTVQDFVCEESTSPWPTYTGTAFPAPRVVISPLGTVVVGFATADGWVARTNPFQFNGPLA